VIEEAVGVERDRLAVRPIAQRKEEILVRVRRVDGEESFRVF
jgi:hypothetical protein